MYSNHPQSSALEKGRITLDLHGMCRWKARRVLFNSLVKLLAEGKRYLFVVHGYHHGTVLRDYIRNGRLLKDLHRNLPLLPDIRIHQVEPGATKISFAARKMQWGM